MYNKASKHQQVASLDALVRAYASRIQWGDDTPIMFACSRMHVCTR